MHFLAAIVGAYKLLEVTIIMGCHAVTQDSNNGFDQI